MNDVENEFKIFMNSEGNVKERFSKAGYPKILIEKEEVIENIEQFMEVIKQFNGYSKTKLVKKMKVSYKNYIEYSDIKHLLMNGENGIKEEELEECLKLIPLDMNKGISLNDFITYLYE